MTLETFLAKLQQVRRSSDGHVALCPAHEDREPSLSVAERDGKILVRCFKGCTATEIVTAMTLRLADLFTAERAAVAPSERRIVATYDYTDAAGALLYQVVRYEPKTFRPRRPDGRGGFTWNLGDVRRVVYRLPELLEAPLVFLVEGEKDADRLVSLGLTATATQGGAENWRAEYAAQLAGAGVGEVVILPDNDVPGMRYAEQAAQDLRAAGLRVLLLRLPGLRPIQSKHGEDVSDWLDAGHTRDELEAALADAREVRDAKLPIPLARLFARPPAEPPWLVHGLIRAHANGWIAAGAKVGKSLIAIDLLLACALGKPWLDQFPIVRPLTVVLIEEEDDEWRVYQRALRLCRGRGVDPPSTFHVSIRSGYRLDDETILAPLVTWFRAVRPDLIVWDVFNRLHFKNERHPEQIMPVLWRLDQLRNELGCANLLAHHSRKPGPAGPDTASGGQRLRGPSEFWGWAENSLYLSPLKGKGNVIIEPESKDAMVEPFKAHLVDDLTLDARRWTYDGTIQARVDQGNENRRKILSQVTQPQTAEQIAEAVGLTVKSVKKHLGVLETEGLVDSVKEPGRAGRKLWMALAPDGGKEDDGGKTI